MRNYNAQNERLKRKHIDFIKETKGRDHKTLTKILAALVKFEKKHQLQAVQKVSY